MIDRAELKSRGMRAFQANYWPCVGAGFLTTIAISKASGGGSGSSNWSNAFSNSSSSSSGHMTEEEIIGILVVVGVVLAICMVIWLIGTIFKAFVLNPLLVGCRKFWVNNADGVAVGADLLYGFRCGSYMNVVKVMFLKDLFVFLWSLLFLIPGVIKAYEWYMVAYLIAEDPTQSWNDVKEKSSQMMDGYKMDTFILGLSFIGWAVLAAFTCGILAIFYVNPYIYATDAELYLYLDGSANYGAGMSANYGGQNYGGKVDDLNFSNPGYNPDNNGYTSNAYTPNNNGYTSNAYTPNNNGGNGGQF